MQINSKIYAGKEKGSVKMKDARVLRGLIYGGENPIEYQEAWKNIL